MSRAGFILDLDRCTGCAACVVACTNENESTTAWRTVHTFNHRRFASQPVFHYSLACNHCLEPSCLAKCPALAYRRDEATGAVLLDRDKCMGCRYWSWVCPYEAPRFSPSLGVMEKCTFCDHRLADDLDPACVTACPTDALRFEADHRSEAVGRPGFPDTGLQPALRVNGERRTIPPKMTAAPATSNRCAAGETTDWRGLRTEISLMLFTSIASLLVAWFTAAAIGGATVFLPVFATTGLVGMAVSALHLGRTGRIYRAGFNFAGSWISREVIFFSAFFVLACAFSSTPLAPAKGIGLATVLGMAALFSMDMVYRVPGQAFIAVPHSAMATLTAVLYLGLFLDAPTLVWPVVALKLGLYVLRRERPTPGKSVFMSLRILFGLLLPAIAVAPGSSLPLDVALAAAVLGELIDRAEFYALLRFLTPQRQIAHDLRQLLTQGASHD